MSSIRITSRLGAEYRDDLERLLFFNPGQERLRARISHAVAEYGVPSIAECGSVLRIGVEKLGECQTLYAIDDNGMNEVLAGVIVFSRVPENTLRLLHIAIGEDYAAGGSRAGELLSVRMIRVLESVASCVRGVEKVAFQYTSRAAPGRAEAASGTSRSLDERVASRLAQKKENTATG